MRLFRDIGIAAHGYRTCAPLHAHALRAFLIDQVRTAGGLEPLETVLRDWHARLSARGRAMLAGAAELGAYLRERG